MRRFIAILAVLISCSAPAASPSSTPPTTSPSHTSSATPVATSARNESPSASPTAAITLRDLSVVAAGEVRGDHALVFVVDDAARSDGGGAHIWDVPLDGSAPRSLIAYTRGGRELSGYFGIDLSRQLSPDGRRLVLNDPVDVVGSGLVVIDLIAGTTSVIATPEAADQPSWSPDGQRIAYRGFTLRGPLPKESGLWVVSASGGAPRQVWVSDLAAGTGATQVYNWTEDGAGIAVARNSTDVSVIDVASGALKRISGPAQVHGIAFRAKRPSVVIAQDQDLPLPSPTAPRGAPGNVGRPGEVVVRDTTSGASQVVYRHDDVGTLFWAPRWNPASDDVLFYWVCGAGAGGRFELVILNAVTHALRTLATQGCVYSTAWSGDGTRVLYADLEAVRIVKADGSGDRELFRPARQSNGGTARVGGVVAFASR